MCSFENILHSCLGIQPEDEQVEWFNKPFQYSGNKFKVSTTSIGPTDDTDDSETVEIPSKFLHNKTYLLYVTHLIKRHLFFYVIKIEVSCTLALVKIHP